MSINLYLDEKKIRTTSGFSEKPCLKDGSGGIKFRSLSLYEGKGRLHAVLGDTDLVPEFIQDFVTDVSMHDNFGGPHIAPRELGVYKENDSTAELSVTSGGKQNHYHVTATGKTLDATKALIRKIKAGTIRPTESHEGAQSGMSLAELEAKLREVTLEKVAISSRVDHLLADLENKGARIRSLYRYAGDLNRSDCKFHRKCLKANVVSEIVRRLDGNLVVK